MVSSSPLAWPNMVPFHCASCVSNSKWACQALGRDGGQCIDGGLGRELCAKWDWETTAPVMVVQHRPCRLQSYPSSLVAIPFRFEFSPKTRQSAGRHCQKHRQQNSLPTATVVARPSSSIRPYLLVNNHDCPSLISLTIIFNTKLASEIFPPHLSWSSIKRWWLTARSVYHRPILDRQLCQKNLIWMYVAIS